MARNKVYDLIKQKAKKYKEMRTNSDRSMSPRDIMMQYMTAVDEVRNGSIDKFDFENGLNKASTLMENRLRAFDNGVDVTVHWGPGDKWQDLRVTGINIIWSDKHILDNPNKEKELYIDIGHMFLEGLFDGI